MKKYFPLAFLLSVILFSSCTDDEWDALSTQEKMDGKWVISSSTIFGGNIPGDGSYIEFQSCAGDTCMGVDYEETDQTSGTFKWWLESAETQVAIDDTTSDGGGYGYTFDIVTLSKSQLELTTETAFGTFSFRADKE